MFIVVDVIMLCIFLFLVGYYFLKLVMMRVSNLGDVA